MSNAFDHKLGDHGVEPLRARGIDTLQINVGKLCNQACRHCHVDAGPHQSAPAVNMQRDVVDAVLRVLGNGSIQNLDLTGGAPELNPHFRDLVRKARGLGVHVIDRCNLSVLFEPGQDDLASFLANHRVEVIASLPFYARERTDRQRGAGVFDQSIDGLLRLNALGYGSNPELPLNLVYNPVGAYLPGNQAELEADYRRALRADFGIEFSALYCLANMPIARFLDWLQRSNNERRYMQALLDAFNPTAAQNVMCRSLISVAPDGTIYDCDFNQMLGLPVSAEAPRNIREFDFAALAERRVVTDRHCLGCTAGSGSSCGGAVA